MGFGMRQGMSSASGCVNFCKLLGASSLKYIGPVPEDDSKDVSL